MPIHLENKGRHPPNWRKISNRIRFERAGGRCECYGQCGNGHGGRCSALHGVEHPRTGSEVILTVAHLDHMPEHCDDDNLLAMCQGCRLCHDQIHHEQSCIRHDREQLERDGQLRLDVLRG